MATISTSMVNPNLARTICRIVGFTCLAGFVVDLIALGLPPDPMALEWRVNFLQQLSDRSIILLFGIALVMIGASESRRLLRQLGLFCLVVGVMFHLACVLVVRDSLVLQQQALNNISNQASQLQTQIQQSSTAPNAPPNVTPELIQQASQQVSNQAESLKQNARTGITKVGIASIGNLVVVGLGLIGLGRFGMKRR
jgi:predicted PurR-regulated permease PerM